MSRKHSARESRRQAPAQSITLSVTPRKSAAQLEAAADGSPDDREELLVDAAGEWQLAGEYDRALSVYDRILGEGTSRPHLIQAYRIGTLWEAGRESDARTAAARLRTEHPHDGEAWNFVAETFEAADEPKAAAEWFTAGLAHLFGAAIPLSTADVWAGPHNADMLLIGRHRVRRMTGEAHDDWDALADSVHASGPHALGDATLDYLHDPERRRALDAGDPEAFRAELDRLGLEFPEPRTADPVPAATSVLFWPKREFTELLCCWPLFADDYGQEHAAHLLGVEKLARRYSDEGTPRLAVVPGAVAGFTRYAEEQGHSPEAASLRAEYAADLASRGRATSWPPPRNGPCWCDSGRKYKKCCGNPALF